MSNVVKSLSVHELDLIGQPMDLTVAIIHEGNDGIA